jgi:RNA polymerase sigma-70 factor (ECF subfamily)
VIVTVLPDSAPPPIFNVLSDVCRSSGRQFLLSIANAELPEQLRAKGGASDLVQETLAAAHAARLQFRGTSIDELRMWLRVILRNEIAMFRRRFLGTARRDADREVIVPSDSLATTRTPVDELTQRERDQRLVAAVDQLPESVREIVVLRMENKRSFEEIGRATGRTAEAARKAFGRALLLLRESVPDPEEGE